MRRLAVMLLCLTGCALTRKAPPLSVRWFAPEGEHPASVARQAVQLAPLPPLRLGRISSAAYIRQRIVYRKTPHEVAFREHWRWSEDPEAFVERALAVRLFQERGLEQQVSGPGLTLEVAIVAFEERFAPRHLAHVELTWRLRNDHQVLVQRTITVDRPIKGTSGEIVATALAAAMAQALDQVTEAAVAALGQEAKVEPTPVTTLEPADPSR